MRGRRTKGFYSSYPSTTFQGIPGVHFPLHLRSIARLDFGPGVEEGIPTLLPPQVGRPSATLVAAVDADGNELTGMRLPDIRVPLATSTGWNVRHPDIGGPGQTLPLLGSTIPFPATQAERQATGDPRPSIEERYASKADYLQQVHQAAEVLVAQGYVLAEDLPTVAEQAAQRYDRFRGRSGYRAGANDGASDVSDAKELLQILVQDGCYFRLGQALQAEDAGDWPANRHVGGPVGAKDHTVDADRVDQHAQGGLTMGRTIAAMSLSRLWQQQGKRAEAYELLASIYGWCTEGFDTADLQETKVLLEELEG